MKIGLAIFLLLLPVGSIFADEADYIVPRNSPLKYSSVNCQQYACFEGVITLNGTLIIGKEEDHRLRVLFIPDSKTTALLPYRKTRGPVTEILVWDETKRILSLVPEDRRERIRVGEEPGIKMQTTIVAKGYQATVDCDHWSYIISTVLSIKKSSKPMPIHARVVSGGCG